MLVLHGAFSDRFFLWGECSFTRSGLHNLRRMRRVGGDCVVDHIWDPGAERILQALNELGFRYERPDDAGKAQILLPTLAEKYPIPSTPLLGEIPRSHIKRPSAYCLRKWYVDRLPLDVGDLIGLMALFSDGEDISRDGRILAPGVLMALDLCYIMEGYRFAASLLERGRFLPDLKATPNESGDFRYDSVWRPLLIGDDVERFTHLAAIMPPVLRSLNGSLAGSSEDVLRDMLDHMVDGMVRRAWTQKARNAPGEDEGQTHRHLAHALVRPVSPKPAERRKRGRLVSLLNPHMLWARALGWYGDTDGLSQSLESIFADVRDWWSRFEWFASALFKLCIRLVEDGGEWRLEYLMKYLQTDETIPVYDVWNVSSSEDRFASGSHMRRYLLLLLGRIGSEVDAVRRSLELTAPVGCSLSLEETADFLGFQAGNLISKGISVIFPDWWSENSWGRLSLCGRLCGGHVEPGLFKPREKAAKTAAGSESLSFKWELALDGVVLTDEEYRTLVESRTPLLYMRGGWTFIRSELIDAFTRRMAELPTSMTAVEALRLAIQDPYVKGFANAPELEALYDSLVKGVAREILDTPKRMKGTLRPYQQRGYSWLVFLSQLGLGACLADDMGLGKTIQTLALIQYRRDCGERRPVLLICPTSVLENWRIEIERFLPRLSIYMHHGRGRARGGEFTAAVKGKAMVLSSYAILQRDAALYQKTEWSGIVLDEGQNIKNPDTQQARASRSIKADWRLVLTGTPVENHVGDLWSIMEFLMPGILGSRRHFTNDYVKPIQEKRDTALMESLRRTVSPFILRRMKTDKDIVPELPEKIETKVFCGLKKEQVAMYSDITAELNREITDASGIRRRGLVLAGLTKIKQICDHPSLVARDGNFDVERSAKMERMIALAEEMFAAGDRTLIFTQYVEMGNILKYQLQERFGKEVMFLHGSVFKDARDRMVRSFQEGTGPQFFVLSLKAGGVGLNLTGANHVVMYDRWWNPAVEQQAIDRAYRIGQSRNVHVHIFCCKGTLEERIDELISSKKEIANKVIESNDSWITELSDKELQRLFLLSPGVLEA